MSPELERLCASYGIELFYHDVSGERHALTDGVAGEILEAMGVRIPGVPYESGDPGVVPIDPVLVLEESREPLRIPLRSMAEPQPFDCQVILEGGPRISYNVRAFRERPLEPGVRQGRAYDFQLPDVVPFGYHTLRFSDNDKTWEQSLIISPSQCYVPAFIEEGRAVGVSLQQYALADSHDQGIGDFGSVERLARGLAPRGVSVLGLSPVHALFPSVPNHRSPYSPSSRLFLNPIYIDLTQVPERTLDPTVAEQVASLSRSHAAVRTHSVIDYEEVLPAKMRVLRSLFQVFYDNEWRQDSRRALEFRLFMESDPAIRRHATYDVLYAHFLREELYGYRQWPEAYRHPDNPAVQMFASQHEMDILFGAYAQWVARTQLLDLQKSSRDCGVSLYLDLAVGAEPSGSEVWCDPNTYTNLAGIGAPPDPFAPQGQNWGLAPMIPHVMRSKGYEPFARMLRKNMMRHGIIRIDHVMGLFRLFWVTKSGGAYVRYPSADLLRILALESQRQKCMVIGEDLGNVPPPARTALAAKRVFSWKVLYFERNGPAFKDPAGYNPDSIATVNTHDLPTLAGFWTGTDLNLRKSLALSSDDVLEIGKRERAETKQALMKILTDQRLLSPPVERYAETYRLAVHDAVHRLLARSSSRLVLVSLHDLLCDSSQPNVPGTVDQYPNWALRYTVQLPDILSNIVVQFVLRQVRTERSGHGVVPAAVTQANQ